MGSQQASCEVPPFTLCIQLSLVLPCRANGGLDVSMGKGHFWNAYTLLTCTYAMLDCYFSEESMFAIKLLAKLMVGTEIDIVSFMWEASNLISIFFFPLSVNPFLALSVLNLAFWLFCAVGRLLCPMQTTTACSCSKSFFMRGLLWPPCIVVLIREDDSKVCE